jgi:hypothetical protein
MTLNTAAALHLQLKEVYDDLNNFMIPLQVAPSLLHIADPNLTLNAQPVDIYTSPLESSPVENADSGDGATYPHALLSEVPDRPRCSRTFVASLQPGLITQFTARSHHPAPCAAGSSGHRARVQGGGPACHAALRHTQRRRRRLPPAAQRTAWPRPRPGPGPRRVAPPPPGLCPASSAVPPRLLLPRPSPLPIA